MAATLRDHPAIIQQRVVTIMRHHRLQIALPPLDELWTAVMASHSDSVVSWVASLSLFGCTRLDDNGQLDITSTLLPDNFATTISTLVAKFPPPLSKLLADHLARRGIFLDKDLQHIQRLALRLSRNDLLFLAPPPEYDGPAILLTGTPLQPTDTQRRVIDSLTPFGRVSKFHALMARSVLQRGSRAHRSYLEWYGLNKLLPIMTDDDEETLRNLFRRNRMQPAGPITTDVSHPSSCSMLLIAHPFHPFYLLLIDISIVDIR
jgi:hypothetical protein